MNRLKHLLKKTLSKESVNTDIRLKVELNGRQRVLPPDEIDKIVDVGVQFNKERQESSFYRILGTLNPLVSNVLFNTSGPNSWEYLNNDLFRSDSILTYADSIKYNLKEVEGWFGYYDPIKSASTLCNFYDMEPKRERFGFIPDKGVKNWELTVTYPYAADTGHTMVKGGLLIVDKQSVTIGGRIMTAIGMPVKHNLSAGNRVRLTGTTLDGEYEVVRTGLDNGGLKDYFFCIDVKFSTINIGPASRMIRMVNGQPSTYYFRKFKKIKTRYAPAVENDDYEIYKLGFSENVYADNVSQFVFNEDIDVSNLTDNLNRPLSEIFVSIIKTDSNKMMTRVSSGLEVPQISKLNTSNTSTYLKNVPAIQKIHNVTSSPSPTHIALELDVKITNNDFYGDLVEYNKYEVKETILSEVHHRFTTKNREGTGSAVAVGPREEGYYYKAHNRIRIRDFSSYIEQGDKNTNDIPVYAENLNDGRYLWRDLLDIGFNDSKEKALQYPFVNGTHYMYNTFIFGLKRQDQFDFWNLYHADFPADPIGNSMINKFTVNSANNVC